MFKSDAVSQVIGMYTSCSMQRPRSGQQWFEGRWRQTTGRDSWTGIRRPAEIFNSAGDGQGERTRRWRDSWSREWSGWSASATVWNVKLQHHRATLVAIRLSFDAIRENTSATANSGFHGHRAGTLLASSRWTARPTDHQDWGYSAPCFYFIAIR